LRDTTIAIGVAVAAETGVGAAVAAVAVPAVELTTAITAPSAMLVLRTDGGHQRRALRRGSSDTGAAMGGGTWDT
jgi:hypothetical protein